MACAGRAPSTTCRAVCWPGPPSAGAGDLEAATRDLDEALEIATRGGMRLHEADCYLEFARLHLAAGQREQAQAAAAKARALVDATGYHRRDPTGGVGGAGQADG